MGALVLIAGLHISWYNTNRQTYLINAAAGKGRFNMREDMT
jgi:hypothetical protein